MIAEELTPKGLYGRGCAISIATLFKREGALSCAEQQGHQRLPASGLKTIRYANTLRGVTVFSCIL
jgi:hypothetical protein